MVVPSGSTAANLLEPSRTSKWFEQVRGGSPQLNHPEQVSRYRTHLPPLVRMWFGLVEPPRTQVLDLYAHCFLCTEGFDQVRGGSPLLNHPEQV